MTERKPNAGAMRDVVEKTRAFLDAVARLRSNPGQGHTAQSWLLACRDVFAKAESLDSALGAERFGSSEVRSPSGWEPEISIPLAQLAGRFKSLLLWQNGSWGLRPRVEVSPGEWRDADYLAWPETAFGRFGGLRPFDLDGDHGSKVAGIASCLADLEKALGTVPIESSLPEASVISSDILEAKPEATPEDGREVAAELKPRAIPDLVTLDQAAASVHRQKRTLERYKTKGSLPEPCVEGGGGKPAYYDWSVMRPWLTVTFGVSLPDRYPANRNPN